MKKQISFIAIILILVLTVCVSLADTIFGYHNGRALSKTKDGFVLIDEEGRVLTKEAYDSISPRFHNGYTTIVKDGLYGLIDMQGDVIIQPTFREMGQLDEGLIPVITENKVFLYINLAGETVIETDWNSKAMPFCRGYAVGYKRSSSLSNGTIEIINTQGEVVFSHDNVDDDFWLVENDDQEGFIFRSGTEDNVNTLHVFTSEGKMVDVLSTQEYSVSLLFEDKNVPYSEGFARLEYSSLYESFCNLMDRNGSVLLPISKYDRISRFENGFAWARQGKGNSFSQDDEYTFDRIDADGNVTETVIAEYWGPDSANMQYLSFYESFEADGKWWSIESVWGDDMLLYGASEEYLLRYYNVTTGSFIYEPFILQYIDRNYRGFQSPIDGLYPVKNDDGKTAFINKNGELVCAFE